MKNLLTLIILSLLLTACRSARVTETSTATAAADTVLIESVRAVHDTTYIVREAVTDTYRADSVSTDTRRVGDTIIVERDRWHTLVRTITRVDTLRVATATADTARRTAVSTSTTITNSTTATRRVAVAGLHFVIGGLVLALLMLLLYLYNKNKNNGTI